MRATIEAPFSPISTSSTVDVSDDNIPICQHDNLTVNIGVGRIYRECVCVSVYAWWGGVRGARASNVSRCVYVHLVCVDKCVRVFPKIVYFVTAPASSLNREIKDELLKHLVAYFSIQNDLNDIPFAISHHILIFLIFFFKSL